MKSSDQRLTTKYKDTIRKARKSYCAITGNLSDPSWYRFRKDLTSLGLLGEHLNEDVILSNVELASSVRAKLPSAGIPFKQVLKFYLQQESLVRKMGNRSLTGEDLMNLIRKEGISVANSTRSKWFEPFGGYRAKRYYMAEEIKEILFLSSIYKARKEQSKGDSSNG